MEFLDKLLAKFNYAINTKGELTWVRKTLKHAQIPEGVTGISDIAFKECRKTLKSVTIPESVTHIDDNAFACCKFEKIKIPSQIKRIPNNCFQSCECLKEITFPDGLTHIGECAFSGCDSLEKITIPDGVTHIEEFAFNFCKNLKEITIPDSVSYIGAGAFYIGYGNILTVHYKGTEEQWAKIQKDAIHCKRVIGITDRDKEETISLSFPSIEEECAELGFQAPEAYYFGKELPAESHIQREIVSKISAAEDAREDSAREQFSATYVLYRYTLDNCKVQFHSK